MKKTVGKAVGWSALESWGSSVLSLAVYIVLARLLAPRAFGLVAMAGVYVSFVRIFVDQGLGSAVVQRANLEREHLDTAFWISVLGSSLLFGVSMLAAGPVSILFGEPELVYIVRWLSLSLIFSGLSGIQRAILQRDLDFQGLAIRSLAASLAGGIAGVSAALMGMGVWSLVVQTLTAAAVGTAVLWNVSEWRPALELSYIHFRHLFGFSVSILGTNLLNFINRRSDDLIIGAFLGPAALGFYTIAYGILRSLTNLLVGVSTKVAFPMFSRLQEEPARMRNGFYAATKYSSLLAFPAFIGMMLVAPEFIRGAYGPQWEASIIVMQILSVIGIIHSVFYFNGTIILSAGKASWRLGLTAINAIVNVLAFLIAVQWGITAVAVAYVLRAYLLSPLPLVAIRKLIRIDLGTYLWQYIPAVGGSAIMAAVVLFMKFLIPTTWQPLFALAIYTLTGASAYFIALYFHDPQLWTTVRRAGLRGLPSTSGSI